MKIFTGCLALLSAFSAMADPGTPASTDPDTPAARIQQNLLPAHYLAGRIPGKSIPQAMLEQEIPGVSIAFVDHGDIDWKLAFGYSDLSGAVAVTPDTVFAAASLSKPVTAMAALNLVDMGLLSLDADVNTLLRDWKVSENDLTAAEKVTLRRLIGHTAGVRNHLWSSYDPTEAAPTLEQMLSGTLPSVDPPVSIEAVPGQRYKYSNPGYSVVRKLVQDATGRDFNAAVERIVFVQAGMTRSSFTQPIPPSLQADAATGYSANLQPYPYRVFPFQAAGGLWTTPGDLARFTAAIMADYESGGGLIISGELAGQVFSRSEDRLGFSKKLGPGNDLVFEHWGSNAGFTSYLVGSLEHQQALVIMTNSDNGFDLMASIARSVAREYDWGLLEPTEYREVSLPASSLVRFAGDFGSEDGASGKITFSAGNGVLSMRGSDGESNALIPVAEAKFISASKNTTYEFLEGRDGTVRWVRVTRESGYNYDLPAD